MTYSMENASQHTWLQRVQSFLQKMQALPEHHRKILATTTMMAATMILVVVVWLSFIPLQDLSLPAVDGQQTADNKSNTDTSNPSQVPLQFGNVSSVSEIGPIRNFLDSFKAAMNLLVPKELQNNPISQMTTNSWQQKLSDSLATIPATFSDLFASVLRQGHAFFISFSQRIGIFFLESFKQIITHTSRTAQ